MEKQNVNASCITIVRALLCMLSIALFLASGCYDNRVLDVRVENPPIPMPSGTHYRFLWHNGREVKEQLQAAPELRIVMPPIPALVILVYPVHKAFLFYPAAVLYTYGMKNPHNPIARWQDGAAGEIFLRILSEPQAALHLNIGKLQKRLAELEDPWIVDIERTATLILSEDRRGSPIKTLKKEAYPLHIPAGRWIPENPLASMLVSDTDTIMQTKLTPGLHKYIEKDDARRLFIRINSSKDIQMWISEE